MVMGLRRFSFNTDNTVYFCNATSQAIASALPVEEESPDSTEQCTGEEPGDVKTSTDSATENNLTPQPPLHFMARGSKEWKGENVR
jgi:hypothetical protein